MEYDLYAEPQQKPQFTAPEKLEEFLTNYADQTTRKKYGIPKRYPMDSEMYPYSLTQLLEHYKSVPGSFPNKEAIPKDELDVLGMYLKSHGINFDMGNARQKYPNPKQFVEAMYPHDPGTSPHLYPITRTDPYDDMRPPWAASVRARNRYTGEQTGMGMPEWKDGVKSAYFYRDNPSPYGTYLHEGWHLYPDNLRPDDKLQGKPSDIAKNIAKFLDDPKIVDRYMSRMGFDAYEELDKPERIHPRQVLLDELRALYWEQYARKGKPTAKSVQELAPFVADHLTTSLSNPSVEFLYRGRKDK